MSSLRFCTEIHVAVERENIQVPGGVVCGNTRAHFATLWCGNTQRITAQCWCIEDGGKIKFHHIVDCRLGGKLHNM